MNGEVVPRTLKQILPVKSDRGGLKFATAKPVLALYYREHDALLESSFYKSDETHNRHDISLFRLVHIRNDVEVHTFLKHYLHEDHKTSGQFPELIIYKNDEEV